MADRDKIIEPTPSSTGSPKRADTLNGSPKTKSIDGGGPNFSSISPKDRHAPPPNNPYRKG